MITWREVLEAEDVDDRRVFGKMHPDITVYRQGRALLLAFKDSNHRVFSTSFTNGGYMDTPVAVANISGIGGAPEASCMHGGLAEHDECTNRYVEKLGFDSDKVASMSTAANMENAVITNMVSPEGIRVSTAITAGIRHNGGRSGDPATFDESKAVYKDKSGTVVILLSIDACLSDDMMFKAVMQATEAKSCVIQELQARSLYSHEVATGSGTDQICVIIRKDSNNKVEDLDRSSGLARTISECVMTGLREAFIRQSGMGTELQSDVITILERHGLRMDDMRHEIHFSASMEELESALEAVRNDRYLASLALAVWQIQDDVCHGIINKDEGFEMAKAICKDLVLGGSRNKVEDLRIDASDSIPEMVSYVAAIKLMRAVEERRCSP